jgi:hypothetical protein
MYVMPSPDARANLSSIEIIWYLGKNCSSVGTRHFMALHVDTFRLLSEPESFLSILKLYFFPLSFLSDLKVTFRSESNLKLTETGAHPRYTTHFLHSIPDAAGSTFLLRSTESSSSTFG